MRIYLRAFERNSRPSKPAKVSTTRMPPIHIGDSTHHHDQVMILVILSTINVISAMSPIGPGMLMRRSVFRVGSSIRMLNTPPGYGAGLELRYARPDPSHTVQIIGVQVRAVPLHVHPGAGTRPPPLHAAHLPYAALPCLWPGARRPTPWRRSSDRACPAVTA